MSFPSYPEYRRTGLPWLEHLPSHWILLPIKRKSCILTSNVDKHAQDGEKRVLLCNYTDVYYEDTITGTLSFMEATASTEQIRKFALQTDDVVVTKDSEDVDDIGVPAHVPDRIDGVVCGYHLAIYRSHSGLVGRYLKYYLESDFARATFTIRAKGLTRVGLSQDALGSLPLPLPSSEEQRTIARFLDHETARIDALIEEQQRLIELLKEKRQAVISHAVTKGLDPDVPMKDSGVEWLGKVPAHWAVDRIKWSMSICKNGLWGDEPQGDENDFPCVRVADFDRRNMRVVLDDPTIRNVGKQERAGRVLKRGDLVLEKSGGGEKQPVGFAVLYDDERCAICSNFTARIELAKGMSSSYWRYLHGAAYGMRMNVPSIKQTSGIQNLDQNSYLDERAGFPPEREQIEIASYLEERASDFDKLIAEAEQAIALLRERRSALISAAVTGKIDVRDWQRRDSTAGREISAHEGASG